MPLQILLEISSPLGVGNMRRHFVVTNRGAPDDNSDARDDTDGERVYLVTEVMPTGDELHHGEIRHRRADGAVALAAAALSHVQPR